MNKKKLIKKIYLDYNATTPVDKEVFKTIRPFFYQHFGNPSSIHSFGQKSSRVVDSSRQIIAQNLNCQPDEIIFTSGATESNNLALKGVYQNFKLKNPNKKFHLAVSAVEHEAVLEPAREIEKLGAKLDIIPVDKWGIVDLKYIDRLIKSGVNLISVMYVNSEVGTVQPIKKIFQLISDNSLANKNVLFHTDATQAANFYNLNVNDLGVDLMSLSGHKIYGPKGIGLLFYRKKTPISPLITGGHQQYNLRSGTLNVCGIVGFAKALEITQKIKIQEFPRQKKLKDYLVEGILKKVKDVKYNCHPENCAPNVAHFSFLGVEGESILIALDLAGVAISTGSACASNNLEASHVLLAMGIKQEIAHNSVRFSLGRYTTKDEINYVIKILPPIINKLRRYSANIKF